MEYSSSQNAAEDVPKLSSRLESSGLSSGLPQMLEGIRSTYTRDETYFCDVIVILVRLYTYASFLTESTDSILAQGGGCTLPNPSICSARLRDLPSHVLCTAP